MTLLRLFFAAFVLFILHFDINAMTCFFLFLFFLVMLVLTVEP
jgi:hypothetical protein